MKICIIGAGSPYTPEILEQLAVMRDSLPIKEISLMDIDESRLDIMFGFCTRYATELGFDVTITKTTDRKTAIDGACFVNTQIRVGGNAARAQDERISLSMGLVGQETTGAGGFAKALRTIPAMLDIANDVAEISPDAWIINYTNPTGLVVEAVEKYSKAKIAGLCAGGLFAQDWTARATGCKPNDVRYDFAGLNHMNFSYNITIKGRPLTDTEFKAVAKEVGAVDTSLILKLGVLPSPYLYHYYHESKSIDSVKEKTRGEAVIELEKDLYKEFADPDLCTKPKSLTKRGGGGYSAVATSVMSAIYNNLDTWAVINTANRGALQFLPDNAVVEVPCIVNASGITPIVQSPPPEAVRGLICAVKNYESLTVEAAVTGSHDTALLALLAHPLVRDYETIKELFEKLLKANREYLTAFFKD